MGLRARSAWLTGACAALTVCGCSDEDDPRPPPASGLKTVRIGGTGLTCNNIDLDGERLFGDFSFVDSGDVRCGCTGEMHACQVVSTSLAAPDPIDP